MANYYKEIREEGKSISNVINYIQSGEFSKDIKIDIEKLKKIIFTGMGSSYFATFPAVIYLNQHKIETYALPSDRLLYYYTNLITNDTLLILISQSGESMEIKKLLKIYKTHKLKIGVTNNPESTLAKSTEHTLFIRAGKETSTTSKTYMNTIAILLGIGALFVRENGIDFKGIPKKVASYIERENELIEQFLPYFLGTEYVALLGRGASLATVYQGALILKEAAHFCAEGFNSFDFRHGPLDMVSPGFKAIMFSPYDKEEAFEKDIEFAKMIVSQGGYPLFVTNKDPGEEFPVYVIEEKNPYLLPFLEIIPLQFMSCKIGWAKGMDPGTLSNIGKVVLE